MPLPAPAEVRGQKLTDAQRANWARQAGFSEALIPTAVAISIAENDTGAVDRVSILPNSDGSRDYGMWQINDKAHADLFARFPQWWSVQNANMARAVYDEAGQSWRPWTTYKTGAYKAHMARGEAAAKAAGPTAQAPYEEQWDIPVVTDTVDAIAAVAETLRGIGNGIKSAAGAVFKAGAWAAKPESWQRVALVVAGGGLLIVGMTLVLKPITKKGADMALSLAGPAGGKGGGGKSAPKASNGSGSPKPSSAPTSNNTTPKATKAPASKGA